MEIEHKIYTMNKKNSKNNKINIKTMIAFNNK